MKINEIRKKLGLMNNKKFIRKSQWEKQVRARLDEARYSCFIKYGVPFGTIIADPIERQTGRSIEIILKVLKAMSEGQYIIFGADRLSIAQHKLGVILSYARTLGIDEKLLLKAIGKDRSNDFLIGISKSIKIIYDHNLP